MAQQGAPEDTFRTHLGVEVGASHMIAALNRSAWSEWQPQMGFPYQPGSGYADLNDQIIKAPLGHYDTYNTLGQWGSNTGKTARKVRNTPGWVVNLTYWWKGKNT